MNSCAPVPVPSLDASQPSPVYEYLRVNERPMPQKTLFPVQYRPETDVGICFECIVLEDVGSEGGRVHEAATIMASPSRHDPEEQPGIHQTGNPEHS